jgi:hypothetical protein
MPINIQCSIYANAPVQQNTDIYNVLSSSAFLATPPSFPQQRNRCRLCPKDCGNQAHLKFNTMHQIQKQIIKNQLFNCICMLHLRRPRLMEFDLCLLVDKYHKSGTYLPQSYFYTRCYHYSLDNGITREHDVPWRVSCVITTKIVFSVLSYMWLVELRLK